MTLPRLLGILAALALPGAASAQAVITDRDGYTWDITQNGSVSDGTDDTFDGAMYLIVSEEGIEGAPTKLARNGREIIVGPVAAGPINVTRKIYVPPDLACARFLEILENPTGNPVEAKVSIFSEVGDSVSATAAFPKGGGGMHYGAASQPGTRKSIAHVFADERSSVPARFEATDDLYLSTSFREPFRIPAGGRIAILHVVAQRESLEDALQFCRSLRMSTLLRTLDPEDRRVIVNLHGGLLHSLGGVDLFRGNVRGDAVRLDSGEVLYGTLAEGILGLETEFGRRAIPSGRLVSLMRTPDGRRRAVLASGERITGRLGEEFLVFTLVGGRETRIPATRLRDFGRRIVEPGGQPENWEAFAGRMLVFRGGDRLKADLVEPAWDVRTAWGRITLPVEALRGVRFAGPSRPVCTFELRDGAVVSGLLESPVIRIRPPGSGSSELPASRLEAIWLVPEADPSREEYRETVRVRGASLALVNGDVLAGRLSAEAPLELDTPLGRQKIGPEQVLELSTGDAPRSVRATLWDGSTLPGRLDAEGIALTLSSGGTVTVPVEMVRLYRNADALPPGPVRAEIERLVRKLGSDDPPARDAAEEAILKRGPAVAGVLRRHAGTDDAEIRKRIARLLAAMDRGAEE